MNPAIAIVGMACCFPDARNPRELWENVLAQRRAFRRMPAERLRLQDYFSADYRTPDALYATEAALIEGYDFNRVRFRVSGATFRSVDLAHWLALDVAQQALEDAGFPEGDGLPLESTGVLVGNTLTGEFSRAASLRLRWPYVKRLVDAGLQEEGWDDSRLAAFLDHLERAYKAPFPAVDEETLAGALSNTIAGRICNYFHFGGGGYTVDGACSSSLLGAAQACSALDAGEIDAALAGGVDLSLDPFELVGFSKAGALARGEMLVYDAGSTGFLPGEGCGFVVLMREQDALARGLRVYALIQGWGLSSDGGGSITRPEMHGQRLAVERAYRRAGYGAETVAFFEGHGTGTPVGDEVEIKTLTEAIRAAGERTLPAAIGSIKANFGHTKAAAGIAGLIKATLAVYHRVLPPTTGVRRPRREFDQKGALLRVLEEAEPWPHTSSVRAGINSFGFGGINVHVAIEGPEPKPVALVPEREQEILVSSTQDVEFFILEAQGREAMLEQVQRLTELAPILSCSELSDLSTALAQRLTSGEIRTAIVCATPAELADRLDKLRLLIREGVSHHIDPEKGIFLGEAKSPPRIAFLFPGQASPVRLRAGTAGRRFAQVRELYQNVGLLQTYDPSSTDVAQLAIITGELAGLRLLAQFGVTADVAIGHSLGEIAAYCWGGALDETSTLDLVRIRGHLMATAPDTRGVMASVSASPLQVESLISQDDRVVMACFNAPSQTVISGESTSVTRLISRARQRGWEATVLPTANAFHSPLMGPAASRFKEQVSRHAISSLRRPVISTITGRKLTEGADLHNLLVQQITSPVCFLQAIAQIKQNVDLFIEVGPGRTLTGLVQEIAKVPAIALDVAGASLSGVFRAAAAAYVLGTPLQSDGLLRERYTRPFDFDRRRKFFVNPCELAPLHNVTAEPAIEICEPENARQAEGEQKIHFPSGNAVEVIRALVSRSTELPAEAIAGSARLLRDLHLNSIVVGEIVAGAARQLGVTPPGHLLQFADKTVGELALALDDLRETQGAVSVTQDALPAGIEDWHRAFVVQWLPRPLRATAGPAEPSGSWRRFGPPGHPLLESLARVALPGNGVIVCLSEAPLDEQVSFLLAGAKATLQAGQPGRYFVVVGPANVAGPFARTLHLENPDVLTRVVEAPQDSQTIERIHAEIRGSPHHVEVRYDAKQHRLEPLLSLLLDGREDGIPIQTGEVVLVSGGGKGIAAECALMVAQQTGARLVLLGRSRPEEDTALAAHLRRVAASGVEATYIHTDVGNLDEVQAAVRAAEQTYGRITGIIHGAGHNQPTLVQDLDEAALQRTLQPKVRGFRNLIAAVDTVPLRLLVTFGSVIGRVGLRGEADYALANSYLSFLTEEFASLHPTCRCLSFESSAWSGVGMAERLGKVEMLRSAGVRTLTVAEGVSWFRHLVARKLPAISVVVAGRLGTSSPVPIDSPALPLRRFLERPRVHYPQIELVVEGDVSMGSDPYLADHVFQGEPLLPAVMGLEAMVQVATAVAGEETIPVLENVRFERPVVVEPGAHVTVRIAALVRARDRVEVALRSSQTFFQVDHFTCTCLFDNSPRPPKDVTLMPESSSVPLNPNQDLYGGLLFQGPRFQRLTGYRRLNAAASWADIASGAHHPWFAQYLPDTLLLGDPATRDAALHSIQACVPDAVLLPVAVERLSTAYLSADLAIVAHASEKWQDRNTYCYDLELRNQEGVLCEYWQGLQLRKVADAEVRPWPDPLAAVFLEWRVREADPRVRVYAAFERNRAVSRRQRTERATRTALDRHSLVRWRSDGKPVVDVAFDVSAAHSDGLTLVVAGHPPVACDLEPVRTRPEKVWRDLLGEEGWSLARVIAQQTDEDVNSAATRVWTANESLAKANMPKSAAVKFSSSRSNQRTVWLAAGNSTISSSIIRFSDDPRPVAVSVLTRNEQCAPMSTGIEFVSKRQTS
jgi:enediyne polyketide synthase